jgi:hypothetical protein
VNAVAESGSSRETYSSLRKRPCTRGSPRTAMRMRSTSNPVGRATPSAPAATCPRPRCARCARAAPAAAWRATGCGLPPSCHRPARR